MFLKHLGVVSKSNGSEAEDCGTATRNERLRPSTTTGDRAPLKFKRRPKTVHVPCGGSGDGVTTQRVWVESQQEPGPWYQLVSKDWMPMVNEGLSIIICSIINTHICGMLGYGVGAAPVSKAIESTDYDQCTASHCRACTPWPPDCDHSIDASTEG